MDPTIFAFLSVLVQAIIILIILRLWWTSQNRWFWQAILLLAGVLFVHQIGVVYESLVDKDRPALVYGLDVLLPLGALVILVTILRQLPGYRLARNQAEIYQKMFENNPAMQWLIDPTEGQIVDANPTAAEFYGYSRETLKTMRLAQINTLPTEKIQQELTIAVQGGRNLFYFTHRLANGETREVEIKSAPIEIEGRPLIYSIIHDITELRKAEESSRQHIRELDAFAYTVAHDLKAPLSIILGYAQILRMDIDESSSLHSYLENIELTAQKMSHIIDELLSFARTYEKEVMYTTLDMHRIVQDVCKRLAKDIHDGGAEIVILDGWPVVRGYEAWVEEIWVNFLSNALKYGGTPPQVTLGMDVPQHGKARFWIKDNGRGLTPEQQAILFKPFQRVDKSNPNSTGLGLWIVRRLVERQGGEVGVMSQLGQGCQFYFTLPIAPPAATETPTP